MGGLLAPSHVLQHLLEVTLLEVTVHPAKQLLWVSQGMDIAAVLRALPHSLQRCPQVSFALQAHAAATQHDCFRFLKLHSEGTWVQQAIMGPRLQQVCVPRLLSHFVQDLM